MAAFSDGFRSFASQYYGRVLPFDRSVYGLGEAMGLTKKEAWKALGLFYLSGKLARLQLFDPWIVAHVRGLHAAGVHVILLTNRPAHKFPNIEFETEAWLTFYDIPYGRIAFSTDKGAYVDELGDETEVLYAIEDMPENALKLAERRILTFVPARLYNVGMEPNAFVKVINGPEEIQHHLQEHAITY